MTGIKDALIENAPIGDALEALRHGRPVLVLDDVDRENEGDVVMAAATATADWVGWMVRHTSGVVCAAMSGERADELLLPPMVADNQDPRGTAYTVTVDARHGITTGISAADRTTTLRLLADPATRPDQLVRPGHVFGLRARPGGVLERPGHTEAAVDLCRLAGLPPVGVISELVDDDGPTMGAGEIRALGQDYELPVITVAQLIEFRRRRVERVAETVVPTRNGTFTALGYRDLQTGAEHLVLTAGELAATPEPLVRVHSECLTGDAIGSLRCDCGAQLDAALQVLAAEGGVLVYLRGHEGRGIGLLAKLKAYALQDAGRDTVAANEALGLPVDAREYGGATAVLHDLGLARVRLLTNNPDKVIGLQQGGIDVVERRALVVGAGAHNDTYLATKRDRLGHHLPPQAAVGGPPEVAS